MFIVWFPSVFPATSLQFSSFSSYLVFAIWLGSTPTETDEPSRKYLSCTNGCVHTTTSSIVGERGRGAYFLALSSACVQVRCTLFQEVL
ncbi:hypothetical protein FKM82_013133 [Ascaphus truei]